MELDTHILVVDDLPGNRLVLETLLGKHYTVHSVENGRLALDYLINGGKADLILLDVVMPEMDGFEVCRLLKVIPSMHDIPVLFLTSLEGATDEEYGLSLGADDFIHKPFNAPVVLARVRNHLQLLRTRRELQQRNRSLEDMVQERTHEVLRKSQEVIVAQSATITAFCVLAEARDNETGNHIRRTQSYVRALAQRLRTHPNFALVLDDETIQLLYKSAPLHDVGKVAIPDAILLKPGKLSAEEWVIMKQHTTYGRDAIAQAEGALGESASFLRYAREIAYGHHERWDGTGYPQGLSGAAIPMSARLMALADVYDALISKRVYKPAFPHEQAIAMIDESSGSHFDPDMAEALLDIADEFRSIAQEYSDAG